MLESVDHLQAAGLLAELRFSWSAAATTALMRSHGRLGGSPLSTPRFGVRLIASRSLGVREPFTSIPEPDGAAMARHEAMLREHGLVNVVVS